MPFKYQHYNLGLLSAQCLSQKVKTNQIKIVACEANPIFCEISNQFIKSIDKSNVIEVINKHSNDLRKKTDLVITEIFDDGLLGENCLDTFYNALVVNKLVDDSKHRTQASTIPKSAQMYIWY
jgi:predicted RNA methylase